MDIEGIKKAGGPAFPLPDNGPRDGKGMTLRDYFAAQALQGMLASTDAHDRLPDEWPLAGHAYRYADAMIKERSES